MPDYYAELEEKGRSVTEESPRQALRRVREISCYGALRVVVGVLVAPGYLAGAIGIFVAFTQRETPMHPLAIAGASTAVLLLTLAVHQALRLLVDIADLMIEQARKK